MSLQRSRRKPSRPHRGSEHVHLSDETLLLWLDGELRAAEAADVQAHLEACWACRGRKQTVERSIADLADYHRLTSEFCLPPSDEARARFLYRLRATSREFAENEPRRIWARALAPLQLVQNCWRQIATFGAVLVALTVVLAYLRHPETVSAEEVLRRVGSAEQHSLASTPDAVLLQRVRITVGANSLTRTIYRDVAHGRTTSRTDASATRVQQAKRAYAFTALEWDSELDAGLYQRWRSHLHSSYTAVRQASPGYLHLQTDATDGTPRRAEMTVREADYHIVSEVFTQEGHDRIELAELSFSVVPLSSLDEALFAPALPAGTPTVAAVAHHAPTIDPAELLQSQLEAQMALHRIGADLGEQVRLILQANKIVARGIVRDETRKLQLESTLATIPHLSLSLETVDEAAGHNTKARTVDETAELTVPVALSANPPVLQQALASAFPHVDERLAFVDRSVAIAQNAAAHAWALKRLAEQYPEHTVSQLNQASRLRLDTLMSDHVDALLLACDSLQGELQKVLPGGPATPLTSPAPSLESAEESPDKESWQARAEAIHSDADAVQGAVAALLASSQPGGSPTLSAAELHTIMLRLSTESRLLKQQVQQDAVQ